ncbi:TetR family transcriptional regulator [Dechloromonas sp. ZY10]|uniref:TetR family transcriptional regulator n=1 Tax=Dechloromonas aquae TaxID=2664436 RepID=UPI0035293298
MVRKTREEAEKTRKQIVDAARAVFHRCGVSRSTLEKIAQEAGVTRGAVYWHFKDKAELFFAVREDIFVPLLERTDSILFSEAYGDPLDAIQASLQEFFRVLDDCAVVREVFEIMILRCEYVQEFAGVQEEVNRPAIDFLAKIERMYVRAAERRTLRAGLDPFAAARDTWAFTSGLLHLALECRLEENLATNIGQMIVSHMALRRA